jgi:iron complex outermembrane recepter protein
MLLAASMLTSLSAVALAQEKGLEEIIVTGVRGAPRTITTSPTPIDVLNAQDIERVGRVGALQALSALAPSFTVPTRAGGGTASVISTGGLRGLNPDQTLVLVNGHRRHKTSLINSVSALYLGSVPVDLDLLPTSAIGRIEVLRDGAAAQYGSDAIAGVINIILKDTSSGGSVSTSWSENFDRGDGQVSQAQGNVGFQLGSEGFVNLSVSAKSQEQSNRSLPLPTSIPIFRAPDAREATADRLIFKTYGQYPQKGVNSSYNLELPLAAAQLYSSGTLSIRESQLPFTPRLNNSDRTTGSNTALPEVYPNGYVPTQVIDETDFDLTLGVRGDVSDWNWDVSSVYGRNRADQDTIMNINASLGPTSPREFKIGVLTSSEWVTSVDLTRALDTDMGELQVSFGAQVRRETYGVEAGDAAGYITGNYVTPAGQPFAGQRPPGGAQATPSFRPEDEADVSRSNYAGYAELGLTPNERFFIGVAGRYENYNDDSGDTLIGKVNSRYELTDDLAVRGAFSTGFRAPSLAQQYYASTTNQFRTVNGVPNVALLIKTLPVGSREAVALGAEPLTPEESVNTSIGLAYNPIPELSLTIDGYRINVDDRISVTSTLAGVDAAGRFTPVSAILVANGLNPNLSAQYFTNAIDTRTEGLDVVASWRQNLDSYGTVRWSLAYNRNYTKILRVKDNPSELAALGPTFVLFDRASRGPLTSGTPQDKFVLGANWDIDRFNLNVRAARYGEFTVTSTVVANDRTYSPEWIVDLEASADITENYGISIGANNLFNTYPDDIGIFNTNLGLGQYPTSSPFGFTGGSYYVRLRASF